MKAEIGQLGENLDSSTADNETMSTLKILEGKTVVGKIRNLMGL